MATVAIIEKHRLLHFSVHKNDFQEVIVYRIDILADVALVRVVETVCIVKSDINITIHI